MRVGVIALGFGELIIEAPSVAFGIAVGDGTAAVWLGIGVGVADNGIGVGVGIEVASPTQRPKV